MSIAERIKFHYPLPIAILYEAMRLETESRQRVRKLVDLFERVTQYLVLVGLASYRQQELSDPQVESYRSGLSQPSFGHWVNLLKAINKCFRSNDDPHFLTRDSRHNYKAEPIGIAVNAIREILGTTSSKNVFLHDFLDAGLEFRNKKIGHGDLSPTEADKIKRPLEEALAQWLAEIPTLYERHLLYISDVKYQNQRFVYTGVRLNSGTSLEPFQMEGDEPINEDRLYLHTITNNSLLSLWPFFAYHPHTQVLYAYSESKQGALILRCPYNAPGADPMLTIANDSSLVVGSALNSKDSQPADETTREYEVTSTGPSFDADVEVERISPVHESDVENNDELVASIVRLEQQIRSLRKTWGDIQEKIHSLYSDRSKQADISRVDQITGWIEGLEKQSDEIESKLKKLEAERDTIQSKEKERIPPTSTLTTSQTPAEQAPVNVAKKAAPGEYSINVGGDVSGQVMVGGKQVEVSGAVLGDDIIPRPPRRSRPVKETVWEATGSPVPLRLDAALPAQVFLGRSFELAVAVRQPDSPVLNEADLNQTKSGNLLVTWPEGIPSVRLRIHVSAPECTIYNQAYSFQLYKGHDSPVFYFQLTANKAGQIGIVVTVYQERDWLGGTRLHTLVKEQIAGQVEIEVFSRPIVPSQEILVNVAFQVEASFNPPELRTLCFDMGVSHDDLRGETHAERVRELVAHMVRRGRFHTLLQQCQKKRSHIDWLALAGITTAPA